MQRQIAQFLQPVFAGYIRQQVGFEFALQNYTGIEKLSANMAADAVSRLPAYFVQNAWHERNQLFINFKADITDLLFGNPTFVTDDGVQNPPIHGFQRTIRNIGELYLGNARLDGAGQRYDNLIHERGAQGCEGGCGQLFFGLYLNGRMSLRETLRRMTKLCDSHSPNALSVLQNVQNYGTAGCNPKHMIYDLNPNNIDFDKREEDAFALELKLDDWLRDDP